MPALPWRTLRPATREREYLDLLSELLLRSYTVLPRFLRFVVQVKKQLVSAPGLIGYSLFARLGSKQFWTLSVWEGEDSPMAFVDAVPHRTAMRELQPHMGETQFIRWAIRGDAYPPMWKEAFARATSAPFSDMPPSVAPLLPIRRVHPPSAVLSSGVAPAFSYMDSLVYGWIHDPRRAAFLW